MPRLVSIDVDITYAGFSILWAIADFDRSIELKPGDSAAYNNRGSSNGKLGNIAKAIADLDNANRTKSSKR